MKSRAIVLHTLKYNDDSLIANVLTEQAGMVGMIVRISRSKRALVRHQLFQPLTIVDIEWDERPRASLQRPKAVSIALPYRSLPYDPMKSAIGLYLAEFLYHAVKNEPPNSLLFQYIAGSMEWLDTCQRGFANFHLVFLLRLTRFLGFMPNVEEYRPGDYFDLRQSVFSPTRPLHGDVLEPTDAAIVPKLMRMRYTTMHVFRFSGSERSRLLSVLHQYYRLHLTNFPEIKSLSVLKELFAGR